jgi:hypothetical protein
MRYAGLRREVRAWLEKFIREKNRIKSLKTRL